LHQFQEQSEAMQRNPHSYQIATGYRTFYSLSLIYQPITKKRLFFSEKDAKTGHKNTSNMADKHPHTPVKVSMMGTPGSQAALQAVFDKRKACLDEKRSRFNRFRTCFRTVPVFIVQLIHSTLSFFTMMVMTDE